ncbi:MAG: hypothetical protein AAGI28_16230 [Pseudomonadota bacterium]
MTSPSQSYWHTSYVLRSQARQKRADAARAGAEILGNPPDLPENSLERLRDILDNLDDPETVAKAREFAEWLDTEWYRALRRAHEMLGTDPSDEANRLVYQRLVPWLDAIGDIRGIAEALNAARHLDIAAKSMLEMGDFALDQGL